MLIEQQAPDFECDACFPDLTFGKVKLADHKGKYVVLFFYPGDFTFVCASEIPGFSKLIDQFEKRNCVVLGVSTDSHHSHKAWQILPVSEGGIGKVAYPLLGDFNHELAKKYDVLLPDGTCTRGLFVIDKEGVVKAEHRNCDPLGRNLEEPLRLLDALQFHERSVAEGRKQVCPASWKLGMKGITPTLAGVGEFNQEGGVNYIGA